VIEQAGAYRLVVGWESVDAHTVDFRFQEGRSLHGPFFVEMPVVVHVETVL